MLVKARDILCTGKKKHTSLSPNRVARRVIDLAANVKNKLVATAKDLEFFLVVLDESTDVNVLCLSGSRLLTKSDERFSGIDTIKGTTTGHDIFQALENVSINIT